MTSVFAQSLFVVSTREQARFLTALPQISATDEITWVAASGAAARGLSGTVHVLDGDFAKPLRLRTAVREATTYIRDAEASVVLAGAGSAALPFLLAARKNATQSIFLEEPSATTARTPLRVAKLADRTLVEWEHQLVRHPFATVLGETV